MMSSHNLDRLYVYQRRLLMSHLCTLSLSLSLSLSASVFLFLSISSSLSQPLFAPLHSHISFTLVLLLPTGPLPVLLSLSLCDLAIHFTLSPNSHSLSLCFFISNLSHILSLYPSLAFSGRNNKMWMLTEPTVPVPVDVPSSSIFWTAYRSANVFRCPEIQYILDGIQVSECL